MRSVHLLTYEEIFFDVFRQRTRIHFMRRHTYNNRNKPKDGKVDVQNDQRS